jgi:hypothetical protein
VSALMLLLASGLALLLGSAVEAATGFGSAMVALPAMEMAFPSHMPALLILLGFPLMGRCCSPGASASPISGWRQF